MKLGICKTKKMINTIRIFSIITFCLIIIAGDMIAFPLIFWLLISAFYIGSIDQIFAILALIGIILNFTKWKNKVPITILSFLFMLSPIISRMVQVPIELFDYLSFEIPLVIFVITYLTFIITNAKQKNYG
ncbi:hypothetical protein [Soonwooa purpurea]